MSKINSALVQINEQECDILKRPCFQVNIRLMKENKSYFEIISNIVDYMKIIMDTKFSDYNNLQGLSGANVGIPFNIVIIYHKNKQVVMLNPVIIKKSDECRTVLSNCGSINLKEPIEVSRFTEVLVRYIPFTMNGDLKYQEKIFKSGTVQHEIEHNLGILITDKKTA